MNTIQEQSGIALNSLGFGIDAAICELNQKQRQAVLESNGIKKASYLTPILRRLESVKNLMR